MSPDAWPKLALSTCTATQLRRRALPLINHVLEKMRLQDFLSEHLPLDDPRADLPTAHGLTVIARNVQFSRQPIYRRRMGRAVRPHSVQPLGKQTDSWRGDDRLARNTIRTHVGMTPQFVIDFTHKVSGCRFKEA